MRGIGKGEELGARAITQTFVRHFGEEEVVAFAPQDASGDADGFVWKFDMGAEQRAIPIDHGSYGVWLGPCGAILSEIFVGKGARAAGAEECTRADAEIEGGEKCFREPRKLEKEHVPTAEKLTRTRAEEFAHHRGMRNVEDDEFGDALRMKQGGAPGHGGAPIMSSEENLLLTELVCDGDDVRDEFSERVSCYSGRFSAEVVAALVGDDNAKSGGGQRLDLLSPAIPKFREAVEKNDDGAVLWASGNRMQSNVSVLELDSFHVGLEAGGAGSSGAHFGGVDAEAETREIRLAERHAPGVEIAPDEEQQERDGGVVFVPDGVNDGK